MESPYPSLKLLIISIVKVAFHLSIGGSDEIPTGKFPPAVNL